MQPYNLLKFITPQCSDKTFDQNLTRAVPIFTFHVRKYENTGLSYFFPIGIGIRSDNPVSHFFSSGRRIYLRTKRVPELGLQLSPGHRLLQGLPRAHRVESLSDRTKGHDQGTR